MEVAVHEEIWLIAAQFVDDGQRGLQHRVRQDAREVGRALTQFRFPAVGLVRQPRQLGRRRNRQPATEPPSHRDNLVAVADLPQR